MTPKRLKILNIWVDAVTRDQALRTVKDFIENGKRPHVIFASNPEKNFSVPGDPELYNTFRHADLLLPDGVGMVKAARIIHDVRIERIPGVEFMEDICRLCADNGYKIFVYGAKEEVNREAVKILETRYPGIDIAGRANGYLRKEEMPDLVRRINQSGAQVLFLALGSPRQEQWFVRYRDRLKTVRVCQGIGGSLDAITGRVKRAPELWCNIGLEWFYRLVSEPRRIRRQKVLPLFAIQVLTAAASRKMGLWGK